MLVALGLLACEEVRGEETNIISGLLLRLRMNKAATNVVVEKVENKDETLGVPKLPELKLNTVTPKTLLPWQDMSLVHRDSVGTMSYGIDQFYWSLIPVRAGSLGWFLKDDHPTGISGLPSKREVSIGLMWNFPLK